jgi:glycerophosphoryl diester phosphodiesterase
MIMATNQGTKEQYLHQRMRDPNGTPGQVFVVAHRGVFLNENGIELAENSIPAIERAKTIGCDMVEVDVRFTSDGTAIVMHDPDLNRTAAHGAVVADTRYNDLKDLDLVHPTTGVSLNAKIPTLEEAFSALGDQMMINVELKTGIEAISEVARLAKQAGVSDQVTIKCNLEDASDYERVARIVEQVEHPVDFIPVIIDTRTG